MDRGGSTAAAIRVRIPPSPTLGTGGFNKPWRLAGQLLRSCARFKERGCQVTCDRIKRSHTVERVFSSCGSQEASVNNEEIRKKEFLIDCSTDRECVVGGIVALGKFDALHIGHRELAIQASKAGVPFLLSFVGMAEVLGWEPKVPIVASCDRKRVLASWAPYCGDVVPIEYQVEFSNVRYLTPQQFVERLSKELQVSGVVAGENYRFGYKAAGDALELVRLCKVYDLDAFIVSSVMDKNLKPYNRCFKGINASDRGQVSSTRVRQALSIGDMQYVTQLLGRKHRLILKTDENCFLSKTRILSPKTCLLNQAPCDGVYKNCNILVGNLLVGTCRVILDATSVIIEPDSEGLWSVDTSNLEQLIGIEFN